MMIKGKKPSYLMENWALTRRKMGDSAGWLLIGECQAPDHPARLGLTEEQIRQGDDRYLTSGRVIFFNFDRRIAETVNSVYELGSIDKTWARILEDDGILLSSFDFDLREGAEWKRSE
jgi:hypothetical protein